MSLQAYMPTACDMVVQHQTTAGQSAVDGYCNVPLVDLCAVMMKVT